jgi:hypothetical protein
MSEHADQPTRERDQEDGHEALATDDIAETGPDSDFEAEPSSVDSSEDDASLLSRFLSPLPFCLVLLVPFLAAILVGRLPLLPDSVTTLTGAVVGLFAGGFVAGLVRTARQYSEAAIAGALVGVLTAWTTSGGFSPSVVGVGLLGGVALAVVGTYFGRDLRAGLTADLG